MKQLLSKEVNDCRVPHVVESSRGIRIHCSYGDAEKRVLVTREHLIMVKNTGYKKAEHVNENDILFADFEERKECRVTKVDQVLSHEKYFGLNCLESEVLANEIKCSTFGNVHSIPSYWMKIIGNAIGVDKASKIGDLLAQLAGKLGF